MRRPPPAPDGRPEVLALRALGLGDLLVAVPALKAIRRAHPAHRLILATSGWLEPVVDLIPEVDALLPTDGIDEPLPLQAGRIDTAVNLHGNGAQSRALLEALAPRRRVGHRFEGWDGPEWEDGHLERQRWLRLVTAHGMPGDPDDVRIARPDRSERPGVAVVHVGAAFGSRHWPAARFATVARALVADGMPVVVTGGAHESSRAQEVASAAGLPDTAVLAGRIDLGELAAMIADARVLVSADTGAAHLASALGTPSVVLFGPAPAEEWGPPPGPHLVLTDAKLRVGDSFGDIPDPALLAVTPADVLEAVERLGIR